MTPRRSEKSYEEIVDAIIDALPVRTDTNITAIARDIGSSWETVNRWLQLIMHVQGLPKVQSTRSPYGRGEVYRRERQKQER